MSRNTTFQRGRAQPATLWAWVAFLAAAWLAWAVRSLLSFKVFADDGSVLLVMGDSAYHARRALYSFVNFPDVLLRDPYMAYPGGSPIQFPPLYDWLLGGTARLFGDSERAFEGVVAWTAVFFATATLLPVFALGRRLYGPWAGVGAAWMYAVLPASSLLSSVGDVDHHAAVSFIGACWLWSSVREVSNDSKRLAVDALLHGLIVSAMALVWSGSLFYIALAEGTRLLVVGVFWVQPEKLFRQSIAVLFAATLVAPWVWISPPPVDGAFSSTALSWLQVLVLVGIGGLAAALGWLQNAKPESRPRMRALRAIGASVVIAFPLMLIPGLFEALWTGLVFVSGEDTWATTNPEQQPLFSSVSQSLRQPPTARFGWLVYGIPALPVLAALSLRKPEQRKQMVVLLFWSATLAAVALRQVRFANDLAPLAALVFAGTLATIRSRFVDVLPSKAATVLVVALAIALLWPAFSQVHFARAQSAFQDSSAGDPSAPRPQNRWESQVGFARTVRAATPETSAFFDDAIDPEYGVLVDPSLGHSILYWGRRPVPANNFGPYLDRQKFDDANVFYLVRDEALAVAALDRLGSRFVVTAARPYTPPMPYGQRVHRGDGYRAGDPVCGPCLRLVTEGPANGTTMLPIASDRTFIPYKLFERVAGALVEIEASPGSAVSIELELESPLGRSFVFQLSGEANSSGRAQFRVPYATNIAPPTRAKGLYRARIGQQVQTFAVADDAVRAGRKIVVRMDRETHSGFQQKP